MIPNPNIPQAFKAAHDFIQQHGDAIWELVCDNIEPGKPFRTTEVAELIYRRYGYSRAMAQRYARAVLRNVAAQPEEPGERRALERVTHQIWRL